VNLEDLRERRRRERQQDSLQSLPETFYADAADYLRELKTAREEAADRAADPYGDPEVRRLTDELQTAESVVESLYERRVGKVVKHASFAAADMPHEREGLTEEERALFDDLVARIKQNRGRVLDTLAGEGGDVTEGSGAPSETAEAVAPDAPDERPPDEASVADRDDPAGMLADAMGVGDEGGEASGVEAEASEAPEPPETSEAPEPPGDRADEPPEAPDEDVPPQRPPGAGRPPTGDESGDDASDSDERTTVRITADVGEIYGVDDRDYDLAAEDVVDLPADNAAPLIEKEAAKRL
jgi:DNA replication factor GINS